MGALCISGRARRSLQLLLLLACPLAAAQPRWTLVSAAGPPPRDDLAMAYDEARAETVLFGGLGAQLYADTWVWDGASWLQRTPTRSPPSREAHRMAYDPLRRRIVLFGGWAGGYYDDTWEWDGDDWTLADAGAPRPAGRDNFGLAWEPLRQRVVMQGGSLGAVTDETWEWDGVRWQQVAPAPRPPRRTRFGLFSPRPGRLLLGPGWDQNNSPVGDTWQSSGPGMGWSSLPSPDPSPRHSYGAAVDTRRREVVLFGGATQSGASLGDTWSWRGSWSRADAGQAPSPRCKHAMAYDSARSVMVLFGGDSVFSFDGGRLGDTWEWGEPPIDAGAAKPVAVGQLGAQLQPMAACDETGCFASWTTLETNGATNLWSAALSPVAAPGVPQSLSGGIAGANLIATGAAHGLKVHVFDPIGTGGDYRTYAALGRGQGLLDAVGLRVLDPSAGYSSYGTVGEAGGVVLVAFSVRAGSGFNESWVSRLDLDGGLLTPTSSLLRASINHSWNPTVVGLGDRFVVAHESREDTSQEDIVGAALGLDGGVLVPSFTVAADLLPELNLAGVAVDGGALFAWEHDGGVRFALVTPVGVVQPLAVSIAGGAFPSLSWHDDRVLVAFERGARVEVAVVDWATLATRGVFVSDGPDDRGPRLARFDSDTALLVFARQTPDGGSSLWYRFLGGDAGGGSDGGPVDVDGGVPTPRVLRVDCGCSAGSGLMGFSLLLWCRRRSRRGR